jgi:MoxR-like ATPase
MSTTPQSPAAAASIEFVCTNCGRMLKVASSAAGKRASCPQCGAIVQVPAGNMPPGEVRPQPAFNPAPASAPQSTWQPQPQQFAPQSWQQPAMPQPQPQLQPASVPATSLSAARTHAGRDTPTRQLFDRITREISKVYVGQDELVLGSLVALFSSGHVLIESVPGLGKTLFVRTLGKVLGLQFGRIQFTADLMPSDVTGAPIFDMKIQEFRFRPGPVFTQLLLADEINRAPAKTHAALLEIMQEYRVTIDGQGHTIERPFLVLATQNPIESEGTYNLPEAQLDRFMFKLVAEYPRENEEALILKMHSQQIEIDKRLDTELECVASADEILRTIHENGQIRVDDRLVDYINKLVRLTRAWPQFHMGASPRAGIALMQAARTLAAFSGRDYAVPDDVVQIALPALRHRVQLTAEAEVEGQKIDDLLTEIIRSVEVPRI